MGLKDIILETIKEVKGNEAEFEVQSKRENNSVNSTHNMSELSVLPMSEVSMSEVSKISPKARSAALDSAPNIRSSEFLHQLQEKTLVLFESLQKSSDTKRLDLVINFLEYQLALIENELENS
ncbi:MAG: hypothetical protein E7K04_04005 [Helicobacter sp.]|nr:hypothetical protein [Helicobacter sp.]